MVSAPRARQLRIPSLNPTMMTRPKPLIAGHSHVVALGVPIVDPEGRTLVVDLPDKRFVSLTGVWPRDQAYTEAIVREARDRTVFLFWMGNQHLNEYLLAPRPSFDFFVDSRPDLSVEEDVEIIPEAVIAAKLGIHDGLADLLARLNSVEGCRPVVCGAPPPKPDNKFLAGLVEKEPVFVETAQRAGVDLALSSSVLRLKLWIVLQETLGKVARDANVDYEPTLEAVKDEQGYLRHEYWGHDLTHAWGGYGDVVRDHLVAKYIKVSDDSLFDRARAMVEFR